MTITVSNLAFAIAIFAPLYGLIVVAYRLLFHPLSKFPGPKLAAATRWYESYYDIIKGQGGEFSREIDRMHDVYGPIVRINPDELHIKDSNYYSVVYSGVRHKYDWAATMVGAPLSAFGTVDHELHRSRRRANAKFLSKRSVMAHEHLIVDATDRLMQLLKDFKADTIDLYPLFLAFTTEIVQQFTLGQTTGLLESAEARSRWQETIYATLVSIPVLKQFGWMMNVANLLPLSVLKIIAPSISQIVSLQQTTIESARAFLRQNENKKVDSDEYETIFHALYNSDLPPSEKTAIRLSQEALSISAAASTTTAHHLVWGVYYLITNPDKLKLFQEAVRSLKDETPSWTALSTNPYINATIKEILRLSASVAGRSPLLAPAPLIYGDWIIPKMTGISLTVRDVLLDPTVFTDPLSFTPERWLGDKSDLEAYFVPFSRGPRNCQGLELAWAELFIGLAAFFRTFDAELVDLEYERDLRYTRECLLTVPREESKGVRVRLKSCYH